MIFNLLDFGDKDTVMSKTNVPKLLVSTKAASGGEIHHPPNRGGYQDHK